MALALLDRASDAFADFIEGAAVLFDIDSAPAGMEEVSRGLYDVGEIVHQKTLEWLGTEPNLVTPANLLLLLEELDELTTQLEAHVAERGPENMVTRAGTLGLIMPTGLFGVGLWMVEDKARREHQRALEAVLADLRRFRVRLDRYFDDVRSAPDPSDRRAVLWEVTAPLFLGWFGGETGREVELPAEGVSEAFDTTVQHTPDLGEPFRIANAFGVWLQWKKRTPELLVDDVGDEASKVAKKVTDAALGILPNPDLPPPRSASPLPYVLAGVAGLVVGGVGVAVWRYRRKR